MIKKLLVVITLAAVVVACGDKKKDNTVEAPKFAGVEALLNNADSLLSLNEVTLVGKLGKCPFSQDGLVLAGKGSFVGLVPAEGVIVDTALCGGVSVTGKLSVTELDSAAVATIEAQIAEKKAACETAAGEQVTEEVQDTTVAAAKTCCANHAEKSCCSAPKVGDKFYTLTFTKVEKFECPNHGGECCKGKEGGAACEHTK